MAGTLTQDQRIREDVSDLVYVADARETPFTSMIKKGAKLKSMTFEYQAGKLRQTRKRDSVPDGEDVKVLEKEPPKAQLEARAHYFRNAPHVGQITQYVNDAVGVKDAYAEAKAAAIMEQKRDIEARLLSDEESGPDDGVNGSRTRGLGNWIRTTAQTDKPVPDGYRTPAAQIFTGAIGTLDEATFNAMLQARWEATGVKPDLLMLAGSRVKNALADWVRYEPNKTGYTPKVQLTRAIVDGNKYYSSSIDMYSGDYGVINVMLSSWIGWNYTTQAADMYRAYVLDMSNVLLRPHTEPGHKALEDKGGGPRGIVDAILGFQAGSPNNHIKIAATA